MSTETTEFYHQKKETLAKLTSEFSSVNVAQEILTTLKQGGSEVARVALSSKVLPQGRYVPRATRSKAATKSKIDTTPTETLSTEDEYFLRPNGSKYFARSWGVHQDVSTLREARKATSQALTEGNLSPMFALLYGAPGTGKTALVEAAFEKVHTILGSGDTEVSDFLGGYTQKPSGGFEWVDGALIRAAENGEVLFIDEVGLIDPKVLSIVYGAMDGRREIEVTANPSRGTVAIHENFYVVAATNPNAPGVRLSEALLSRFTLQVEMTTDWMLAKKLGVPSYLITAATNLSKKQENGELSWSPQMRELLAFRDIEKVFGQQFALQNLLAGAPELDRPQVADVVSRAVGSELKPARI